MGANRAGGKGGSAREAYSSGSSSTPAVLQSTSPRQLRAGRAIQNEVCVLTQKMRLCQNHRSSETAREHTRKRRNRRACSLRGSTRRPPRARRRSSCPRSRTARRRVPTPVDEVGPAAHDKHARMRRGPPETDEDEEWFGHRADTGESTPPERPRRRPQRSLRTNEAHTTRCTHPNPPCSCARARWSDRGILLRGLLTTTRLALSSRSGPPRPIPRRVPSIARVASFV